MISCVRYIDCFILVECFNIDIFGKDKFGSVGKFFLSLCYMKIMFLLWRIGNDIVWNIENLNLLRFIVNDLKYNDGFVFIEF